MTTKDDLQKWLEAEIRKMEQTIKKLDAAYTVLQPSPKAGSKR
mgnify:CR=1 FL=1